MKRLIVSALLAGLVPTVQATEYNAIQPDKSALTFQYRQMGVPMEGKFGRYSAQVSFDPAKPATGKASLELELGSVDAGSKEASDEVAGKDWFNTKTYPKATFISTGVQGLGGNRYQVTGKMTVKGRTKEVSAPFTLTPQAGGALLEGAFTLRRADFAIGEGPWSDFGTVANEIQIKFRFFATAKK